MGNYQGSLKKQIEYFSNDANWNTLNRDGSHRFDKELIWIENMVNEYALAFKVTPDEMMEQFEKARSYSWPNYYQEANFPKLDSKHFIGTFTLDEFYEKFKDGFVCPSCGRITKNPQECKDGEPGSCDWKAYGLLCGPATVIIKDKSFIPIHIFYPVGFRTEG